MSAKKRLNYAMMNHIKKGNKDKLTAKFFEPGLVIKYTKFKVKPKKRGFTSDTLIRSMGGKKLVAAATQHGFMSPSGVTKHVGFLATHEKGNEAIQKTRATVRMLGSLFPRIKRKIDISDINMHSENLFASFYNPEYHNIMLGASKSYINNANALGHEATHAYRQIIHPGSYHRIRDELSKKLRNQRTYHTKDALNKDLHLFHPEEKLAKKIELLAEKHMERILKTRKIIRQSPNYIGKALTQRLVLQAKQGRRK